MDFNNTVKVVAKKNGINYAVPVGRPTAESICEALPRLNAYGYSCIYDTYSEKQHEELRAELLRYPTFGSTPGKAVVAPDALNRLLRWLRSFRQSNRWTRLSSYSLKHVFERETGVYVTDGLFILGALMAGFPARFSEDSPTADFQMCREAVR